jgi:hypothetical protein
MKTGYRVLWLSYFMAALVVWSCVASILNRAEDPTWVGPMTEARRNYDVIAGLVAVYAVVVAYGIFRRREWGRVLGISLAVIVLFIFLGTPLLVPVLTSGIVPIELEWDAAIMALLSIACITSLVRLRFREH